MPAIEGQRSRLYFKLKRYIRRMRALPTARQRSLLGKRRDRQAEEGGVGRGFASIELVEETCHSPQASDSASTEFDEDNQISGFLEQTTEPLAQRDIESLSQAEPSRIHQLFNRHRNKIVLIASSLLIHLAYTWFQSQQGGTPMSQGSNIVLHVDACYIGNDTIPGASNACNSSIRVNQTV